MSDALTFERPRLLLVDDEPAVLDGFTTLLRREFLTVVATSGAEALAIVETARPFAAVLSDMGVELAALEARRDKTRDLKQAMMQELLTGKTRLVPAGAALA